MDKEIYKHLAADISKNFALDTVETDLELENFFEQFREKLSAHIFDLLQHDYNRLLAILYRIDVDEKKVRNCLEGSGIFNVSDALADLIIERLIQKIKFRMAYKNKE
jgi:hypothetical protein